MTERGDLKETVKTTITNTDISAINLKSKFRNPQSLETLSTPIR